MICNVVSYIWPLMVMSPSKNESKQIFIDCLIKSYGGVPLLINPIKIM